LKQYWYKYFNALILKATLNFCPCLSYDSHYLLIDVKCIFKFFRPFPCQAYNEEQQFVQIVDTLMTSDNSWIS
ncbi:MAG: hypothetical protein PF444_00185, partial [Bacteroidales bacterium]|nr:hypothetical protein [Bacteroidales bacterium]